MDSSVKLSIPNERCGKLCSPLRDDVRVAFGFWVFSFDLLLPHISVRMRINPWGRIIIITTNSDINQNTEIDSVTPGSQ